MVRQRVVFVGLDGATWDVMHPMIEAGRLPNLAALVEEGCSGPLTSTIPPNSSLAWTSFQTGCHPGKHGVFFFRENRPGSYDRPVISWDSVCVPSIWRLAADQGRKVVTAWFPLTWPPEEWKDGVNIGGLLTPDSSADLVRPRALREKLSAKFGSVPADNEPELFFHSGGEAEALACLRQTTDRITEIGLELLQEEDPDLFALVFRGVDLASHRAWRYRDPVWVAANPKAAAAHSGLLESVYEQLDEAVGRFRALAQTLPGDTVFVTASDHGFGPITHRFFVNAWLVEHGYLVLKPDARRRARRQKLRAKGFGLLRRLGLAKKLGLGFGPSPEMVYRDMVDWSQTRCWSSFSGGEDIILLNLRGREPEGTVAPGAEAEQLLDEVAAALQDVRAEDGTAVVARVWKREDLWQGPQLHLAPDLQFLSRETAVNAGADPLHPRVVELATEGVPAMHRMQGMYAMQGPGIRTGHRHAGPQIADMGPTLLHLLGLPVEDHMDGQVLEDCMEPDWLLDHPMQMEQGRHSLQPRQFSSSSAPDDERLLETMRALGYME